MHSEAELAAGKVIEVFDALGISYFVGGSVASIVHGIPRLTQDVDLVVDLHADQVDSLVAGLDPEFHADGNTMREAIKHQSCCNVIHLGTMVKVDIFVRQQTAFADSEWSRRQRLPIGFDQPSLEAFVASAEDMILQKLVWYRMTGERSDRQWGDVTGMLKVRGAALDFAYLRHWATDLDVAVLLERAISESGLSEYY
jgi:hypothetical protein